MKALSVVQPYAELILAGKKTIEIRNWRTKFRGDFLVHSSQRVLDEEIKKFGYKKSELVFGAIVGKATLVNVKEYKTKEDFLADHDKHLADGWYKDGETKLYGFILKKIERVEKPIHAIGNLHFWEFEDEEKLAENSTRKDPRHQGQESGSSD
jgi:ASC-1-like (ASCH) protein